MKIAEYKQMMEYLTRPGFNGGGSVRNKTILPKKKPEEEVKKRKIKNFEKAKPALENPKEVKEMIDKPKRGLVDEPGSYSGEKVIKTYSPGFVRLEDYQDGTPRYRVSLIRTTEDGKKVSIKQKFKNYKDAKKAFDDFNIKNPLTILGEEDYKKLLPKFKTLINKPKKYPSQASIRKKLNVPRSTFNSLLDLYLKEGNVLPKNRFPGIDTSLAGGKRQQIIDAYKANKTLNIQDLATKFKVDRTTVRRILKNAGLRDPSEFQNISDKKDTKTKSRYKTLKKITDPYYESTIIGNDYVNLHHGDSKRFNVTTRTLGYAPPRINSFLLPKLETYLNNLYDQREDLLKKKPKDLIRKLEEINIKGMNLVSNPQVKGYLNFKIMDPKTLKMSDFGMDIATTIDPADLLEGKNIKDLSKFDKGIIELARKEVMAAQKGAALPSNVVYGRGGPKPGKGQKTVYGKQAQKIVQDVERVSEKQIKEIFKDLKIKNTDTAIKAANKIKKSPLPMKVKGALLTTLLAGGSFKLVGELFPDKFQDTAAIGDAPIVPEGASIGENVLKGTAATGAAASVKPGRDILKFIGGKAASGFNKLLYPLFVTEAPPIAFPVAAYKSGQLLGDIKRGEQTDSTAAGITASLAAPRIAFDPRFGINVFGDKANKFERFLRRTSPSLKNLTRLARGSVFATPFIETGIQGYNAYKALQDARRNASVFEPRVDTALGEAPISYYNKIMSELPEVDRSGAAGGGIMKMAGKSSGPPPEAGPTPQGLDFLMKRGR